MDSHGDTIQNESPKECNETSTRKELRGMMLQFLLTFPIVFLSAVGYFPFTQIVDQVVYVRLGGNISSSSNESEICENVNGSDKNSQDEVQSHATMFKLYMSTASCIAGIVSMPFWCGWSDSIGRQVGIIAAFLGMFIKAGCLLVVVQIPSAPLWILIVSDTVLGLFGKGAALIFAGVASHVADVTPLGKRTLLMLSLEFGFLVSAAIGNLATGYWIEASGFTPIMLGAMACHAAGLIYTIIVFERCSRNHQKVAQSNSSVIRYITSTWHTFTRKRPQRPYVRRLLLILESMLFIYYCGFLGSYNIINIYTLGYPLCWGSLLIGINNAVLVGSSGIFPLLFGALCYSKGPTPWLVLIGLLCGASGCVLIAFSKTTWMMLFGVTLFAIRALVSGTSRSIVADIVDDDEIGAGMAGYGIVAIAADLVASVAFNYIYSATLSYCKGCVFLTGAAFYCVSVLILGLFVGFKKVASSSEPKWNPLPDESTLAS